MFFVRNDASDTGVCDAADEAGQLLKDRGTLFRGKFPCRIHHRLRYRIDKLYFLDIGGMNLKFALAIARFDQGARGRRKFGESVVVRLIAFACFILRFFVFSVCIELFGLVRIELLVILSPMLKKRFRCLLFGRGNITRDYLSECRISDRFVRAFFKTRFLGDHDSQRICLCCFTSMPYLAIALRLFSQPVL